MNKRWLPTKATKWVLFLLGVGAVLYTGSAFAEAQDLGEVAKHVRSSFGQLARLITAAAYVAGMGFAIGAILKFKQHKDNPTQIPVGTPIALIFIAAALIFLPTLFSVAGHTLFETPTSGGISGIEIVS